MRPNKLTKTAVTALEDIKARDITVLDVRSLTSLYDTLVIATAESARQTKALAHHVRDAVNAAGGHIVGTEGEASGEWVLVDCDELVVHIMQPATRTHYNLEELWTPPEPMRLAKSTKKATSSKSSGETTEIKPKRSPSKRAVANETVAATARKSKEIKATTKTKSLVSAEITADVLNPDLTPKPKTTKSLAVKKSAVKKVAAKKATASAPTTKKPLAKKTTTAAANKLVTSPRRRLKAANTEG